MLVSADNYHAGLMNLLESLHDKVEIKEANNLSSEDTATSHNLALDRDVLLLKATSSEMLKSLSASYILLHKHHLRTTSALPQSMLSFW